MYMSSWGENKYEEWRKKGKDFLVSVYHWKKLSFEYIENGCEGEKTFDNCWNVYAYIYPDHLMFEELLNNKLILNEYLHGGQTFYRKHYDDEHNITSIQIGSDYLHLHDSYFRTLETEQDARDVFCDAEKLFDYLTEQNKK